MNSNFSIIHDPSLPPATLFHQPWHSSRDYVASHYAAVLLSTEALNFMAWIRPVYLGLILNLTWIFYRSVNRLQSRQALEALEAAYQCQPPRTIEHRWPFGFDRVVQVYQSFKTDHMAQFFESLFLEGGNTFQMNILGDRILATHEAENIETIVSSKLQSFTTSSRLSIIGVLIKNSLMTQEGAVWKHTRGLMRVPLSRPQYHDLAVVKRHVDNLIAILPTDQPVDLTPLFFRFTMDAATSFLFGKSVGSLVLPRDAEEEKFEKAFDYCFAYVMRRGRLGKLCWLLNGAEFRKSRGTVFSYIDKVIQEASMRGHTTENQIDLAGRGRTPLLDALLEGKDDRDEVRDHMLLTLAAARQTTTALLTWTLRLLVRNPLVMSRLRTEIESVVKGAGRDTPLTRDHIKKMTYLSCILQEVLRLYPLSHAIANVAKENVVLPVGGGPDGKAPVLLRAGEAVNICLWTLHRRKDFWGEDAEDFRPERWEGDLRLPNLFYYIPFLRGPRNCPSQDFALTEASYLIIRLLQEFSVIRIARNDPMPVTDKKTERFKMGFVIESADGCLLEFER